MDIPQFLSPRRAVVEAQHADEKTGAGAKDWAHVSFGGAQHGQFYDAPRSPFASSGEGRRARALKVMMGRW